MRNNPNRRCEYILAERESKRCIDAIIESSSRKKVVVAGPGTGKTFLFKKVIEGKRNALTLTFVNALVQDLSLDLYGMSDVKTLHSFARGALSKITGNEVKIFPKFSAVIRKDAEILLGRSIDFDSIFYNMRENEYVEFYKNRKDYYGGYYGYSDVIYDLVKSFQEQRNKLPSYDYVLVDEYQDFNESEITLIELLSEKSPVLIAGDDDQALYEELKSASAKHIRQKFSYDCVDYESFTLPYCRRSTRVIVEAVNDIISVATKKNFMRDRIQKKYKYFDHEDKDAESDRNPKITHSQQYSKRIPWFIEKHLKIIARDVKGKFSVLIIAPTKTQCRSIVEGLKNKGFTNIEWNDKKDEKEPTLLDGLKILLNNINSNLGWRISSSFFLTDEDFENALRESDSNGAKDFSEIIDKEIKKQVKEILRVLRAVRGRKETEDEKLDQVLRKIDFNPYKMAEESLRKEILLESQNVGTDPGIKKIQIKVTTIESSKGLSADYVFITYFDDKYFIKDNDKTKITQKDVCKFLVALTRARKKVLLVSSDRDGKPTFFKWIKSNRIEIAQ